MHKRSHNQPTGAAVRPRNLFCAHRFHTAQAGRTSPCLLHRPCKLPGILVVGHAYWRTAAIISACCRPFASCSANLRAPDRGRRPRRRRKSAKRRAAAGAKRLTSRQAVGVDMPPTSAGGYSGVALLASRSKSRAMLRRLQPCHTRPLCGPLGCNSAEARGPAGRMRTCWARGLPGCANKALRCASIAQQCALEHDDAQVHVP